MLGRWLIVLSGARQDILDQCQSERAKFQGLGGAILTTSGIAVLSMTFALASALKVFLPLAVLAGLAWGVAILSLDRWLVASLPPHGGRRFWLALPRILLALLLGAVISTPLVLQIFKPEIDAQIVQIQRERGDAFVLAQQSGGIGQRIAELEKSAADLQNVIDSGGKTPLDPANDPRMKELVEARKEAQAQQDKFYQEWQCQLYGGANCLKPGSGPLARKAKENLDAAQKKVRDIDKDIAKRREELAATDASGQASRLAQATEDLNAVRSQLATLNEQQNAMRDKYINENVDSDGLLLRLDALNEVSKNNTSLNAARALLFLFFMLIECLPVMVKLMQRAGMYDRILAAKEKQEMEAAIKDIRAASRRRPQPSPSPTRSYAADQPPTEEFRPPPSPPPP
ncbi:DUF4407 domain-containing protein, partial [Acrocarpospora catenulata]|uniref:DUF4407 domain-containing protein n=1 Tax=Acrocarpospora catenulata TaxID=2836182 RepID=UPI0020239F55